MVATAGLSWSPQIQEQQQEGGAPAVTSTGAAPAGGAGEASPGAEATSGAAPVYETLGEDDQIIYDLQKEHAAKVLAETPDEPPAPPPAKGKKPAKGEKPADPPAPAAPTTYNAIVKYKTPDEAVGAIVAAIESGDAKKIAKALGKPEAFLDASDAKWMVFREQQNGVRERAKALETQQHEFNRLVAEARTEYGPAIKAAKAYKDGDLTAFVTLVQELTGESYEEAQRKVIKGEIAVDPVVRKLRDELAAARREQAAEKQAEKQAREEAEQQTARQTREAQAIEAVGAELAGHRVAKLRGFEKAVIAKVRESWDGSDYTMSLEEAADALMADRDAEAEALGYSRPAPALPAAPASRALPAPAAAPSLPPRARAADARTEGLDRWADPKAPDMDDDEILASIQADIKAGRLKA